MRLRHACNERFHGIIRIKKCQMLHKWFFFAVKFWKDLLSGCSTSLTMKQVRRVLTKSSKMDRRSQNYKKSWHFLLSLLPFSIFLLRVFASSSPLSPTIVTYNDTCGNQRICNQSRLLVCISGVCQCESPSNQRYDHDSNICLGIVGGQCTLLGSDAVSISSSDLRERKCISNANCVLVTGGISNYTECQCETGFIENAEGNCVPGIGKPCSYEPEDCNPLGMVVCKNAKCSCLDELQVYDQDMRRCVSPAGTHCKFENMQLGCTKNAICYPFYYWVPPRCICKPGYVQTKNRTCILEVESIRMGLTQEDL